MELNKFILLLLLSSFISFYAEAICIPRNVSSPASSHGAVAPSPSHEQSLVVSPSSSISSLPSESPEQSPDQFPPPPPVSSPPSESPKHKTVQSPTPSSASPDLQKICFVTEHPEECMTSIGPVLTGFVDPISVLKIEIQALRKGFEKAVEAAKTMMKDPQTSAWVKSCLDTCLDVYDTGVFDLDNAMAAIASRDIYRLQTLLSSAVSYVETCKDSFAEQSGVDSPMKEIDGELEKLAANNMAIATSFQLS